MNDPSEPRQPETEAEMIAALKLDPLEQRMLSYGKLMRYSGHWVLWLQVENQSFRIGEAVEDRMEAFWTKCMLAKALTNVVRAARRLTGEREDTA